MNQIGPSSWLRSGVALIALTTGLALSAPASAATIKVPGDFNKIQDAVDDADPGDTVAVSKKINIENVIVSTENVTIKGVAKGVVIDGYDETNGSDYNVNALADGVKIQNLALRNGYGFYCSGYDRCGATKVTWSGEGDGDCFYADGNKASVKNSKMSGCGSDGVEISGDDAKVTNTAITRTDDGCIDLTGDRAVVSKNKLSSCEDGDGIYVSGEKAQVEKNVAKRVDGSFVEVSGDDAKIRENKGDSASGDCYYLTGDDGDVTENKGTFCDGYGVYSGSDRGRVEGNRLSSLTSYGIYASADQPKVNGNSVAKASGYGFYISCGVCTNATFNNNKLNGTVEDDYGAYVAGGDKMEIIGNKLIDATDYGMYLSSIDDAKIKDNLVKGAGSESEEAIYLSGNGNTVTGNSAIANGGDGFSINGNENVLKNNLARGNDGDGIFISSSTDNVLISNTAKDNAADGFENDGTDTVVKKNDASGNRRDCANDGTIATNQGNKCADKSDFDKPGTASRRHSRK